VEVRGAHDARDGRLAAHRRGSPVRAIAPAVPPWYERYLDMILCRPVTTRAMRMAFSLASAPPLVKKNVSMSPGVIAASFAPSLARVRWP